MSINGLESIPTIGKVAQVLTYLNVKEDILDLYGFLNNIERETFPSFDINKRNWA